MTALEPPACIGIVGAGPLGLEATLYARFLGYRVHLLEAGALGDALRPHFDLPLSEPVSHWMTSLGLRALMAQDDGFVPLEESASPTVADWYHRYLEPLAQSDLVSDCLTCHTRVAAVISLAGDESEWEAADEDHPEPERFELLTRQGDEAAAVETRRRVSAVFDATGAAANREGPAFLLLDEKGDTIKAEPVGMSAAQASSDPQSLVLSVPHFYRLGAALHAADESGLPLKQGHHQIRDLFKLIGDRASLDLYQSITL